MLIKPGLCLDKAAAGALPATIFHVIPVCKVMVTEESAQSEKV